jgi:hypothetical protein
MSDITCTEAETLIDEASSLGNRVAWERDIAELALLFRIAEGNSMADITCDDAATLIEEGAALGNRAPWERDLARLALLNRIANGGVLPPTMPQIYLSTNYGGAADPNGVVTAAVGSIYFDTTIPASPVQWIKGGGGYSNTGWV